MALAYTVDQTVIRDALELDMCVRGLQSKLRSLYTATREARHMQARLSSLHSAIVAIETQGLSRDLITKLDPRGQFAQENMFFPRAQDVSTTPVRGFAQESVIETLTDKIREYFKQFTAWLAKVLKAFWNFLTGFGSVLSRLKASAINTFRGIQTKWKQRGVSPSEDAPAEQNAPAVKGETLTHIPATQLAEIGQHMLMATEHVETIRKKFVIRVRSIQMPTEKELKGNTSKYIKAITATRTILRKVEKEIRDDIKNNHAGIYKLYNDVDAFIDHAGDDEAAKPTDLWATQSGTLEEMGYTPSVITELQNLFVNRLDPAREKLDSKNDEYNTAVTELRAFIDRLSEMMPERLPSDKTAESQEVIGALSDLTTMFQSMVIGLTRAHIRAHTEYNSVLADYAASVE